MPPFTKTRLVWPLLLSALVALLLAACESDLSSSVEGKECDTSGGCLPGYTCDGKTNLCIKSGGAPPSCDEGETVCSNKCVIVRENAEHCGGCGTVCTAPDHADPVCVDSQCRFTCQEGYVPCGDICVDTSDDLDHCGRCGNRCVMPENGSPTCTDGE